MNEPAQGLTAKQLDSVRRAVKLYNIWEGAVSSGKTVGSLYRFIMFIQLTMDLGGAVVMTGRTRDSVWRNCILPMMDQYPGIVTGNLGAPTCRILGRLAHVIGASDAKAESVIRGMTILGAYVDEVTTLPEAYFKMLISRLRITGRGGGLASKLFGTTNPDGPRHWFKVNYLDNELASKDWTRFHFTIDDNPRLSPEYVRAMHAQFKGLWFKRFILGLWVQAEGAIYESWEDERHVVPADQIPKDLQLLAAGVDYGSTNPSRAVLVGVGGTPVRIWAVAEWAPATGLSEAQQSASLRAWLAAHGNPPWVAVDPAAAGFRRCLFQDGQTNVVPGSNAVLPGIRTLSSLLTADRMRISETCKELIKEIPGYVWDAKQTAKGQDAPIKLDDHSCDAWRYAIFTTRHLWQPLIPIITTAADDEDREEAAA